MGRKKNKQLKKKVSAGGYEHSQTICEIKNNSETLCSSEISLGSEVNTSDSINKTGIQEITNETITETENEITFESYFPNSRNITGREYYVHSLCQICKVDPEERTQCPKCLFVTYCSHDHRREHWPEHADLCCVIANICKGRNVSHIMEGSVNISAEKFRIFRFQNMMECENKVERPLEKWEKEMFIFPNVCSVCYEYNIKNLVACSRCRHTSFCNLHQAKHREDWCEHLLRYKNIVKNQDKFGVIHPCIPKCKLSLVIPKLSDIEHVFKGVLNDINELEFFELTEITTYPLTTLNALLTMVKEQLLNLKKITLHIVGAESNFETSNQEKWEYYILHLIPELESLEIEFIGPELNAAMKSVMHKVCPQCVTAKKSLRFRYHNGLYHTFSDKPGFPKPSLICVFNPGLYRTTGFNGEDTWSPSIVSMFKKNCHVLTTAYTHKEIHLDVERVKSIQKVRLVKDPTLNPFCSLKPNLNFVSDEESPVIFKNQFYCIMNPI